LSGEVEPKLESLNLLGLSLAEQRDVPMLLKAVTDAGIAVTRAAYGAFIYRDGADRTTRYVAGAPPDTATDFPIFDDVSVLASPIMGAVSRSDDLLRDLRYGQDLPFRQMPKGTLPARSYLAAPVRSDAGDVLGCLFFGHPGKGFFHQKDERLIAGLALHAAIAFDNAHLYVEAQKARASADAANGLKDEFLATLSHELRTPLTAIMGWAHLLKGGRLSVEATGRAVDTIIRNATTQSQIINELLDSSRIVTGAIQLDLRPLDLSSVVRAAVNTVAPAATAKEIHLQVIESPPGCIVLGDPERLRQAFWNLFSNAIKFTPKSGSVRISVEPAGSNVEVVVADSGLGINPDFLPRVFDRFTQDDSSSTRHSRGLGLGLSIVRQLVELHGGSISAESPGMGKGATFTAVFPRSLAPIAPLDHPIGKPAPGIARRPNEADLTGVRVLVVEDDEDTRGLIEKVLDTEGARVRTVSSAREALDLLREQPFDVLLSDIEMAGTDGYDLIRELRLRPAQQGGTVPAAALTAYAETEDRQRALRAGFQLHLPKPIQPSELVTVVATLAARHDGRKAG
jgi:signal transduction histidine kinase/CheY-like chemotaxis protein